MADSCLIDGDAMTMRKVDHCDKWMWMVQAQQRQEALQHQPSTLFVHCPSSFNIISLLLLLLLLFGSTRC
jgi:hypothetical protein